MHNFNDGNRVTTKDYWNSVWGLGGLEKTKVIETDFYFGKKGLFSKFIELHLGDVRDKRILELGGGGLNYRLLSMRKLMGASVTAIDFSEKGIEALKELFNNHGVEVNSLIGDIFDIEHDEKFDIVVHWGVAEHFIDPRPIIEKSFEMLKPGGELLFSMPNMEANAAFFWRKWSPENWSKHVYHDRATIDQCLIDSGFIDIDCFYYGLPFFKTAAWEKSGVSSYLIDLCQKAGSGFARVMPIFHRIGSKYISMERGFYARKPASASSSDWVS